MKQEPRTISLLLTPANLKVHYNIHAPISYYVLLQFLQVLTMRNVLIQIPCNGEAGSNACEVIKICISL